MKKRYLMLPICICSTLLLSSCNRINVSEVLSQIQASIEAESEVELETSTIISEIEDTSVVESEVASENSAVTSEVEDSTKNYNNLTYVIIDNIITVTGVVDNSVKDLIVPNSIGGYYLGEIEFAAFEDCRFLESITLPFLGNNADSDSNAFFGYVFGASNIFDNHGYVPSSLKSAKITGGLTVRYGAFYYCDSLTSISVSDFVTTIEENAFADCTGLTAITIPTGVTSIGDSAFKGCSSLTSMILPFGETNIGESVFFKCTNLTSVTFSVLTTSIGKSAFKECSSLVSVDLPDRVETIGESAFEKCTGLLSINLPEGLTSIGRYAFLECESLITVTLPNSITKIEEKVFNQCDSLTSIIIPASVTAIESQAFFDCASLTKVYYTGEALSWDLIDIGHYNTSLNSATKYFYSEEEPTGFSHYWHYVDGDIVIW